MLIIEEDRGTYYGTPHSHNGYYAGDFSGRSKSTANELRALSRIRRHVGSSRGVEAHPGRPNRPRISKTKQGKGSGNPVLEFSGTGPTRLKRAGDGKVHLTEVHVTEVYVLDEIDSAGSTS